MISYQDVVVRLSEDGKRSLRASFSLDHHDLAVLVGENGSGKTSLLDVAAGVRLPFAGRIVLDPADSPIAYVVQEAANALLPWRTLLSNMLLPAQLQGHVPLDVQERAMSLLSRFGLKDRAHDFPYKLSGGERQILNLVRALLTPASIVLLDEPFAPLNAVARLPAASLMLEYASARTTILVTHDPADLDWPFTRYFEIADSQVVEADRARIKRQLDRGLRSVVG